MLVRFTHVDKLPLVIEALASLLLDVVGEGHLCLVKRLDEDIKLALEVFDFSRHGALLYVELFDEIVTLGEQLFILGAEVVLLGLDYELEALAFGVTGALLALNDLPESITLVVPVSDVAVQLPRLGAGLA